MKNREIVGIYLAAGRSRRMGDKDKLNLPLGNSLLGKKGLDAAHQSKLDRVYVVSTAERVNRWNLPEDDFYQVVVVEGENGLSESIKAGIRAAVKAGVMSVLILLADQPFITADWINCLIDEYRNGEYEFVASSFCGILSSPAIISQSLFSDLLRLQGDVGARKLFFEKRNRGRWLESDNKWLFFDIDTEDDYIKSCQFINGTSL